MHIGRHNSEQKYYMRSQLLESVKEEKDLWIWLSSDMKVSQQCSKACSKAYRMSGLIKRTIENKNKEVMLPLYKSLVRPHVDYCSFAWSPHYVLGQNPGRKSSEKVHENDSRDAKTQLCSQVKVTSLKSSKCSNASQQYRLKRFSNLTTIVEFSKNQEKQVQNRSKKTLLLSASSQ